MAQILDTLHNARFSAERLATDCATYCIGGRSLGTEDTQSKAVISIILKILDESQHNFLVGEVTSQGTRAFRDSYLFRARESPVDCKA